MKNVLNYIGKFLPLVLVVAILFFPVLVHAQQPPDPGGDPDVPVDGGLSLLLAAGIGYGVKKIHDKRKNKSEEAKKHILARK
jgi:hypothetical protein